MLALRGRHAAQIADCILDHAAPFRGKIPHLRIESPRLLLLLRSQVLPDFHAVQHPLLLLGWQVVEVLQTILEPLLTLGREAAELRIAVQHLPLLLRRKILILAQPLPGMVALKRRPIHRGRRTHLPLRTVLRRPRRRRCIAPLRHARRGTSQRQRGSDRRYVGRHGLAL